MVDGDNDMVMYPPQKNLSLGVWDFCVGEHWGTGRAGHLERALKLQAPLLCLALHSSSSRLTQAVSFRIDWLCKVALSSVSHSRNYRAQEGSAL